MSKAKESQSQALTVQERSDNLALWLRKNAGDMETLMSDMARKVITPERIIRLVATAAQKNEKILTCTRMSIFKAFLTCMELGLEPNTESDQIYLIPLYNSKSNQMELQAWPGYMGLVAIAYRTGEVLSIKAKEVYDEDFFDFDYGTDFISHKPEWRKEDRGEAKAYYVIIKMRNGERDFTVMRRDEVEYVRDQSAKKDKHGNFSPAWVDWFDRMAIKTVVRRGLKLMPQTRELSIALDLSALSEGNVPSNYDFLMNKVELAAKIKDMQQGQLSAPAVPVENAQATEVKEQLKTALGGSKKQASKAAAAAPKPVEEDDGPVVVDTSVGLSEEQEATLLSVLKESEISLGDFLDSFGLSDLSEARATEYEALLEHVAWMNDESIDD